MTRKNSISALSVFLIFLIAGYPVQAFSTEKYSAKEWGVIINLSGRQRMLTQKMSKELLLMAAGEHIRAIDVQDNYRELLKSSALFDHILDGLLQGDAELGLRPAKGADVRARLKAIKDMWIQFRPSIDIALTSEGNVDYFKVASQSLPLLNEVNKAVKLFEKKAMRESGKKVSTVINYAGRQRMLIQKMAKEMLLVYLKHENRENLFRSMWMFEETMRALMDGDSITTIDGKKVRLPQTRDKAILAQLAKVRDMWQSFRSLLNDEINEENIIKMSAMNMKLLREMDIVVKMYEVNQDSL
ncbi:MAG TPA: hypothetical protein ENI99_13170 [Sedimenticola sp.]|nr:hypothetical protein [Sedimenticola sp.]